MNNADQSKLIYDVAACFGIPWVIFIMFQVNIVLSSQRSNILLKRRLSLVFCIVGLIFLLATIMFQDRNILMLTWTAEPILLLAAVVGCVAVFGGTLAFSIFYWKACSK
jgi:hypothetical protein